MKRITALALALILVATLIICNGFTLRDKDEKEETPVEDTDSEDIPVWLYKETTLEDEFGDIRYWCYLSMRYLELSSEDGDVSIRIETRVMPADMVLENDEITDPIFMFIFFDTTDSEEGETIYNNTSIPIKIKVDNVKYSGTLEAMGGAYFLINGGDNKELYDKLETELNEEKVVDCVVTCDDTSMRFEIDGKGYKEGIEYMDNYNTYVGPSKNDMLKAIEGYMNAKND